MLYGVDHKVLHESLAVRLLSRLPSRGKVGRDESRAAMMSLLVPIVIDGT